MDDQEAVRFDPGSLGILRSGGLFKTRTLLWAALLFAISLAFFFGSVFGATWLGLRGDWGYVPAILLPVVACWIYMLLVRRFEQRSPWEFQGFSFMLPQGALGFVFGGAFIAGMWLLLCSLKLYTARRGAWTNWFDDLVFDSYISAVLEELAFRAILLRILARIWGVRTGVILSSVIFGLVHLTHHSWLGVFGIILNAGLSLGLLYVITGRLWMSIGMHLGFDFVETSLLGVGSNHGFFVSLPKVGVADWLTGGSFGPDAAVPAMIFGLLVNIVLWRIAFRRST